MPKQKNNVLYTFFYILFSIWPWRTIFGIAIGMGMGIAIGTQGLTRGGIIMIWIMVMMTGWWVSYFPALMTTRFLKKIFTPKQ